MKRNNLFIITILTIIILIISKQYWIINKYLIINILLIISVFIIIFFHLKLSNINDKWYIKTFSVLSSITLIILIINITLNNIVKYPPSIIEPYEITSTYKINNKESLVSYTYNQINHNQTVIYYELELPFGFICSKDIYLYYHNEKININYQELTEKIKVQDYGLCKSKFKTIKKDYVSDVDIIKVCQYIENKNP